jgi:hypothetical protein
MLGPHLLFDAVGAKAFHAAAYEQLCLIKTVAKGFARITEHHQMPGLPHEGRHVADIAMNDDVDPLHRDAAARRRISFDNEKPAMAGGACVLGGVPFDDNGA